MYVLHRPTTAIKIALGNIKKQGINFLVPFVLLMSRIIISVGKKKYLTFRKVI